MHAEVLYGDELRRAVDTIHDAGAKVAVALKPHTPPEVLEEVIARLDMVLEMSVEPGFSGQSYIEGSEEKAGGRRRDGARGRQRCALSIEVDGGVSEATVERPIRLAPTCRAAAPCSGRKTLRLRLSP